MPFAEAFAKASPALRSCMLSQAGSIVRQIHEAGHHLPPGDSWTRRLGIDPNGDVCLAIVEPLPRDQKDWRERGPMELNAQRIRLSRSEQLRFLRSYLQKATRRITPRKVAS
jgi:hypothetical protein